MEQTPPPIHPFSYQLGAMDCFCEMVYAGVKQLALSHPCNTREERDAYLPHARELCRRYGIQMYAEDSPLLTDLFPLSLNQGKYNILFYRNPQILEDYLALKERKRLLQQQNAYQGQARYAIAQGFGRLLTYPPEAVERLVRENCEKEPSPTSGDAGQGGM